MDLKLSIPRADDLTKESGWIQLDRYLYFIPRLHLHVEMNQTGEFAVGDILRTFDNTSFSETEVVKTFEEEIAIVDLMETTRSIILANELTGKIATTITGAAKLPSYQVSAEVGASLEQTIHASLETSLRSSETASRRGKRTLTVSQQVRSGVQERQVAVAGYRKYRQRVYLHYIDYLFVEYRSTKYGLRKKKHNLPRPVEGVHKNLIPINLPLFKLFFWTFETESLLLYTEMEYQNLPKVEHPDRVTLEPLKETITLPLPAHQEAPALYTLANIAFPQRWVDRKGPWTREELEQIELEEARGSAWWDLYGPESRTQVAAKSATFQNGISGKQLAGIFISYARTDVRVVQAIYKTLLKNNHHPWMDIYSIKGGENWLRAIYQAIEECQIFLAVLSNNSVSRRGVIQKELKKALDKWEGMLPDDIYIVPLRIDDCPIPELLKDIQIIDWENGKGKTKLLEAIKTGLTKRGG